MAMTKLKVENFGPIKSVDVSLGDLNILIGPQVSGKSLFLEKNLDQVDGEETVSL